MQDAREDFKYTGTDLLTSTEDTLANYNRWVVGMLLQGRRSRPAERVLDFGAGVGSLAVLVRQETGMTPETLEIDPVQREILKRRGFDPVEDLAAVPAGVDFVYTSNVLEHIPDDVSALRALRDKIAPDGRIAIYVPAFELIWSSLDDKVGHHRRYTKSMLRDHLQQAGFRVETICYRDSVGFMLALLFRFIGNESGEPSPKSLVFFDRVLLPISRALDLIVSPLFGKNVFAVASPA
jgi:SAM-dependent methyltransferase